MMNRTISLLSIICISIIVGVLVNAPELTSLLSLLVGISIVIWSYQYNKVSFFLLLWFFVGFVWCMFSLYYIELGNYISEQHTYGENIGALLRYVLYEMLFIMSIYGVINVLLNKPYVDIGKGNVSFFHIYSMWLFIFTVMICILIAIIYGFPLLYGMNRFEFQQMISPFNKIFFIMPIVAFLLGMLQAQNGKIKYIFYLSVLVLFLILFSDKSSGIYGLLMYFFMGYYLNLNSLNNTTSQGVNNKVVFIYFPLIFIFLLTVVSVGYIYLHGEDPDNLQNKILARALGLQAHVWYGIDFRMFFNLISNDFSIFWLESNEPIQPAGLEYLMYQIADEKFVNSYRDAGVSFTNGYPAIVIISFGYIYSIPILVLLGFIVGYFLFYTYQKIKLLQPIRLSIALIFFNSILKNVFIMGEIYYIYKLTCLLCFFMILLDVIVIKHRNISINYIFENKSS